MRRAIQILLIVIIGTIVLTGCGSSSEAITRSSGLTSSQLTLDEAEQVALDFLDAWEKSDYTTMYSLLKPNSQAVYSQETFAQIYSDVATQMTLNSLETLVSGSAKQGTTAIIPYSVTFNSQMLGEIVDSGRVMRLIETPEGWRIVWSTMDIFDTLAEGTRLELRQTIPPRGNIYDRNGQVLHLEISDLEAHMNQFLPETRFLVGETDLETYQIEALLT